MNRSSDEGGKYLQTWYQTINLLLYLLHNTAQQSPAIECNAVQRNAKQCNFCAGVGVLYHRLTIYIWLIYGCTLYGHLYDKRRPMRTAFYFVYCLLLRSNYKTAQLRIYWNEKQFSRHPHRGKPLPITMATVTTRDHSVHKWSFCSHDRILVVSLRRVSQWRRWRLVKYKKSD